MPTTDEVRLARWRDRPYSYAEVGVTAGLLPAGYHHVRVETELGRGAAVHEQAVDRLLSWEMHRRAGVSVITSAARAAPGAVVVQRLAVGPLGIWAGCRVVRVEEDGRRAGFAYGTLAGHPIAGEESFVVEQLPDDRVRATITAFDRPGTRSVAAIGPVRGLVQRWVLRRYLAALRPT